MLTGCLQPSVTKYAETDGLEKGMVDFSAEFKGNIPTLVLHNWKIKKKTFLFSSPWQMFLRVKGDWDKDQRQMLPGAHSLRVKVRSSAWA